MAGRGRGLLQSLKEKKEEKIQEVQPPASISPPRSRLITETPEEPKPSSPQFQRRVISKFLHSKIIFNLF